jgi:uncharacterized protein YndB with AHSA1/START domain
MIKIESSVVINRPVEDVFAYTTDFSRYTEWIPEVKESKKTSADPVGVGATNGKGNRLCICGMVKVPQWSLSTR